MDLVEKADYYRSQNKVYFKFLGSNTIFWDGVSYECSDGIMKQLHTLLDKYVAK